MMSRSVTSVAGLSNGLQQGLFAADAASSCSKWLVNAALADAVLGVALRGAADRAAVKLTSGAAS
jgi:hypothetical protein